MVAREKKGHGVIKFNKSLPLGNMNVHRKFYGKPVIALPDICHGRTDKQTNGRHHVTSLVEVIRTETMRDLTASVSFPKQHDRLTLFKAIAQAQCN